MSSNSDPSPQERLTASRQAIIRHMHAEDEPQKGKRGHRQLDDTPDTDAKTFAGGTWQSVRRALHGWWHHHPAQLALDLAKPVLGKYADEKPLQLIGIAAIAGAAVVLIRPWRLVSITGLAVAALKSSNTFELLLSLLSAHPEQSTNDGNN